MVNYPKELEEKVKKNLQEALEESFIGEQNNDRTAELIKQQANKFLQEYNSEEYTGITGVDVYKDPIDPTKLIIQPYSEVISIEGKLNLEE